MTIWQAIQKLDRLVFTTREAAFLTGMSLSAASQMLDRMNKKDLLKKIKQGVWALTNDKRFSPYLLVPHLESSHICYVSFISALHIYGIIEQIPQTTTVATTAHGKTIATPAGVFRLHQIAPSFFCGFDWHESRNFLIATPEKALVDSLYLASRKGKRYASFPELHFPSYFKKKTVRAWALKIKDNRIQRSVLDKLKELL